MTEPPSITKPLSTMAIDNHGHAYNVSISIGGWQAGESLNPATGKLEKVPSTKWVLRVHDTPGSWYLDGLLEMRGSVIYLDFGQRWMCTNLNEIIKEAKELL